ncbi:hypothetical protein ACIA8G_35060 [Lentzea sp. NPDC051213]|uniref:hypothetical protein n=1 Tax=Lentzea sp. NPDC051213 TaxID=3364126 RepID=UPI0037A62638
MIHIIYRLQDENGDSHEEEVAQAPHVPRVGELVGFDPMRSYQVIDVLWHLGGDDPHVSITARELNWHRHIAKVTADWESANR